jgi:hypothetical protein
MLLNNAGKAEQIHIAPPEAVFCFNGINNEFLSQPCWSCQFPAVSFQDSISKAVDFPFNNYLVPLLPAEALRVSIL